MFEWWPWHRAHRDAELEVARAERDLAAVRRQWPHVRSAAASMKAHQERNGFADAIRAAMGVRDT